MHARCDSPDTVARRRMGWAGRVGRAIFLIEEVFMANMDRRDFLKAGSIATVGTYFAGSTKTHLMAAPEAEPAKPIAANDTYSNRPDWSGRAGPG